MQDIYFIKSELSYLSKSDDKEISERAEYFLEVLEEYSSGTTWEDKYELDKKKSFYLILENIENQIKKMKEK